MAYSDPAGNPAAAQARINDLSLKVTAPDGSFYWGNNGLGASNFSTAGGRGQHHRHRGERVRPEPDAGQLDH